MGLGRALFAVASRCRSPYIRAAATWWRRSPTAWAIFFSAFFMGRDDLCCVVDIVTHLANSGHPRRVIALLVAKIVNKAAAAPFLVLWAICLLEIVVKVLSEIWLIPLWRLLLQLRVMSPRRSRLAGSVASTGCEGSLSCSYSLATRFISLTPIRSETSAWGY